MVFIAINYIAMGQGPESSMVMKKQFCDVASDLNMFLILNEVVKNINHEIQLCENVYDHARKLLIFLSYEFDI